MYVNGTVTSPGIYEGVWHFAWKYMCMCDNYVQCYYMLFSWVSEEGRDQRRMGRGPGGGAAHGPQLQPLPATPKRLLDSSSHHSPIVSQWH